MERPVLQGIEPTVDRARIGISYSGGGPRLILELGAILAFIERGIVPDVIAGVSAGALAGTLHAIDPRSPRAVEAALRVLPERLSTHGLGLTVEAVMAKAIRERGHIRSLGDHAGVLRAASRVLFEELLGTDSPRVGIFQPPQHPRLLIGATDWRREENYWFGPDSLLEDALVASTAIPGVFPWLPFDSGDGPMVLVDGGVISNQPLSRLALEGCGTIIACGFRAPDKTGTEPGNVLQSLMESVHMLMHACVHLEEDYVRLKLGDAGRVHRVQMTAAVAGHTYDFTAGAIAALVDRSRAEVLEQLVGLGF